MNLYDDVDVLIIGTGIAGLVAALKLSKFSERKLNICVLSHAEDPLITNTSYAQGGIIYSKDEEKIFVRDLREASGMTNSEKVCEFFAQYSAKYLEEILIHDCETNFEKDHADHLLFTKEAAHSSPRILYRGDYTGLEIQKSLLNYLKNISQVKILSRHTAIDLVTATHHGREHAFKYDEDGVLGAYVFNQESKKVHLIMARKTIIATGGMSALYRYHTNRETCRGDGLAMAKRAGAQVLDMEYVQFHPTALYLGAHSKRFLISEAVRGEGGVLINKKGEAFMQKYHPLKELAPRDIVSRSIVFEMIEQESDCVYLDISHKDPQWIQLRFPKIYEHCLQHNLDITKTPIPVVPAAHYSCGGIKTNLKAETNLKNLYAVGEVACTGLHGANRLASTSLLEGLTFAAIAAEEIMNFFKNDRAQPFDRSKIKEWIYANKNVDKALIAQDYLTIKQTMWNYAGLIRSQNRLKRAFAMMLEMKEEVEKFYKDAELSDELIGLKNAVEVSLMVIQSSMRNQESVGTFYKILD